MKMTGAEIVVACLVEQGVDTVFGYPGGAILNVYDALYKHRDKITHYLSSHEQGASHMADGYARATGKVGVCLATSGPGATNLVTGIATAYMDSVPLVAITCNVTLPLLSILPAFPCRSPSTATLSRMSRISRQRSAKLSGSRRQEDPDRSLSIFPRT